MPVGNVCFEPYPQGPVELSLMEPYHIFFFIFSELPMPALWSYANNNNNGVATLFSCSFTAYINHSITIYIYIYIYEYICLFWVCKSPSKQFLAKLGDTYPIKNRMRANIKRENPESIIRDRDFIVAIL